MILKNVIYNILNIKNNNIYKDKSIVNECNDYFILGYTSISIIGHLNVNSSIINTIISYIDNSIYLQPTHSIIANYDKY